MTKRADGDRRGFLLALGRASLAACLGGGVGALVLRDRSECVDPGLCRGCRTFDTCQLPPAGLARQQMGERPTVD